MEFDLKKVYISKGVANYPYIAGTKLYPIGMTKAGNFVVESDKEIVSTWVPELFWKYFEEYREPVELWIREWNDGKYTATPYMPEDIGEVRHFKVREVIDD